MPLWVGATIPLASTVTMTVNSNEDSTGGLDCTLRDAISSSNLDIAVGGCPAGDSNEEIVFDLSPVSPNTIVLLTELPSISANLSISGQGEDGLVLDTNGEGHVMKIDGGNVTLNNLTLTGSDYPTSAGFTDYGGLIVLNSSEVTLNDVIIHGNETRYDGGGIRVETNSTVGLYNSKVFNNYAYGSFFSSIGGSGGGISADDNSMVNLTDSSVFANRSKESGGGVSIKNFSRLNAIRSGFNNNLAGIFSAFGGGIYASTGSQVSLSNSTVSSNGFGRGGVFLRDQSNAVITNAT